MRSLQLSIILLSPFLSLIMLLIHSPISKAEDLKQNLNQTITSSQQEDFKKAFGSEGGITEHDNNTLNQDRLKLSGSLSGEWQLLRIKEQDEVRNPWTLQINMDSHLKNDIRGFISGSVSFDTTIDESVQSLSSTNTQKSYQSKFNEMKLLFHIQKKIFWTLGVQKIKYGASHFWNPSDFLNQEKRDFLKSTDERSGINLVKAHAPIEKNNFYAIANFEKAYQSKKIGMAARAEIPFKYGEWSFTSYSREGQNTLLGSDISFGLGDIDAYAEAAQTDQGQGKNISGGLSYTLKYSEKRLVSMGAELFWQDDGTENKNTYPALMLAQKWVPFNIGKSYSLIYLSLPNPNFWQDSSWQMLWIKNNSDQSSYLRTGVTWIAQQDLSWTFNLSLRSGEDDSEMHFAGQEFDCQTSVEIVF